GGQILDDAVEQGPGLTVDPVQVLEDHDQRLDLTLVQQYAPDAVTEALAANRRIQTLPLRLPCWHVKQPAEWSQARLQSLVERQKLPRHLFPDLPRVVPRLDLEVALQEIDHREVGAGLTVRHRACLEHEAPLCVVGVGEFPDKTRFAYPRLSHDRHDLAVPRPRPLKGFEHQVHLRLAANEPREAAGSGRLKTGSHGRRSRQGEGFYRRRDSRHTDWTQRLHLDEALGQTKRARGHQNRARIGHLFHPRRQVRHLPDRRVVHVEVGAYGADDYLSRVQPDPDADRNALRTHLVRVRLDRLLHPERRITRPHRVVFMGERRPEKGHDSVAHDLIHHALVAVDGLHHPLEHRIQDFSRLLGVAVGKQFHRALEVSEKHRHLLALALKGALGGEDLLGQVLGGVAFGRRIARGGGCLRRHGGATGSAKVLARCDRLAAGRAGLFEPRAAVLTETGCRVVLSLAPDASHLRFLRRLRYVRNATRTDCVVRPRSCRRRSCRRHAAHPSPPGSPPSALSPRRAHGALTATGVATGFAVRRPRRP